MNIEVWPSSDDTPSALFASQAVSFVVSQCNAYGFPFQEIVGASAGSPVGLFEYDKLVVWLNDRECYLRYFRQGSLTKAQKKSRRSFAYARAKIDIGDELQRAQTGRKESDVLRNLHALSYLVWSDRTLNSPGFTQRNKVQISYRNTEHFVRTLFSNNGVIGYDTEGQPPAFATVASRCSVYWDVAVLPMYAARPFLDRFFADARHTVVVCDASSDMSMFRSYRCTVVDIQNLVRDGFDFPAIRDYHMSLVDIINKYMNTGPLSKPDDLRAGNWNNHLTGSQIFYASVDALWVNYLYSNYLNKDRHPLLPGRSNVVAFDVEGDYHEVPEAYIGLEWVPEVRPVTGLTGAVDERGTLKWCERLSAYYRLR